MATKEPLGNGMTFSFIIKPQVAEKDRDEINYYLVKESSMLEYFDDPRGRYEDEEDKTVITIRFMKSKFSAPIDDPVYKEINEKYIKYVTELFKQSTFSCELLESSVLADMQGGMKVALYNFDNKLTQDETRVTKDFISEQQDK